MSNKGSRVTSLEELGKLLEESGPGQALHDVPGSRTGNPEFCPAYPVSDSGTVKAGIPESVTGRISCGQRVVLMDSHLYGIVVHAGRTVTVRLDDGMEIVAGLGDVAAADPEEEKMLGESSLKPCLQDWTAADRSKGYSSELKIDLHLNSIPGGRNVREGRQLDFQMDFFRRSLNGNIRHRGMRITFVHGVGDGILRRMIARELDEVYALRCSYTSRPELTVVTVK